MFDSLKIVCKIFVDTDNMHTSKDPQRLQKLYESMSKYYVLNLNLQNLKNVCQGFYSSWFCFLVVLPLMFPALISHSFGYAVSNTCFQVLVNQKYLNACWHAKIGFRVGQLSNAFEWHQRVIAVRHVWCIFLHVMNRYN